MSDPVMTLLAELLIETRRTRKLLQTAVSANELSTSAKSLSPEESDKLRELLGDEHFEKLLDAWYWREYAHAILK